MIQRLKRFLTGIPDYIRYLGEEIRNVDADQARFEPGELALIPVAANLKRASKSGSYASRVRKLVT